MRCIYRDAPRSIEALKLNPLLISFHETFDVLGQPECDMYLASKGDSVQRYMVY